MLTPALSVIIPASNEADYIGTCLTALFASGPQNAEAIVVANGCRDATADVARLLTKLKQENVTGIILDLRRNGGGSLKEAIDLNTRVTAELSIALANIWNMESAQLMGMGEAGVMDAATAAEEQKFIKVLGGE